MQAPDATRRTSLAAERTMLAWVRTGLASTAVALGVGRVFPEVVHTQHEWPYVAVGAGYALLGASCVYFGFRRQRTLAEVVPEGGFVPPAARAVSVFAGAGIALALATVLLLVVAP